MQIVVQHAERRGFSLDPSAEHKLISICSEACKSEENGNGRFCRNLVENAILSYAERIYGDNADADASERDFVLQGEDFAGVQIRKTETKRLIGF